MSDNSAILALPYIQPNQAQKHVTHNEALQRLDVLVQLRVNEFDAVAPPANPTEGDVYALSGSPTGLWAGQAQALAVWRSGLWEFITPQPGWRAWGQSEKELRIRDGAAWVLPVAAQDNLEGLGIGTTSDATNRLSVKAAATLFSHDGDDHRLKINKANSTDTASLLFQSDWSGHAEIGLSGGTDFAIKVSGDGSNWTEALRFDGSNGKVSGAAVQSSATDATAGRLMKTGAFGWGLDAAAANYPPGNDLDALTIQGVWRYANSAVTGSPSTAGSIIHLTRLSGAYMQIALSHTGRMYIRSYALGLWSSWVTMAAQGGAVSFADITGTGLLTLGGNELGGEQQIIADDAVGSFTPPRTGGFATITCNGSTDFPNHTYSASIYYDVGVSLNIQKNSGWASVGNQVATVVTDVAGTTGADGNITLAVQDGVLKIENRSGGSKTFQVTYG